LPQSIEADWIPLLAYGLAILSGATAALRSRRSAPQRPFWLMLTLVLLVLAALKLLEAQSLLAGEGRELARETGWYGSRRIAQAAIVGFICLGSLGLYTLAALGFKDARYLVALTFVFALCAFVAVRGISLHQLDSVLYREQIVGIQLHRILEPLLTLCVGASALLFIAGRDAGAPARLAEAPLRR
jgi:hypothetical protein